MTQRVAQSGDAVIPSINTARSLFLTMNAHVFDVGSCPLSSRWCFDLEIFFTMSRATFDANLLLFYHNRPYELQNSPSTQLLLLSDRMPLSNLHSLGFQTFLKKFSTETPAPHPPIVSLKLHLHFQSLATSVAIQRPPSQTVN